MTNSSTTIDENELQAYVDGRLAPERRAVVEDWLKHNPHEAERIAAYAGHRQALREALQFKVDEPVPARLEIGQFQGGSSIQPRRWLALAASLLIAVALGGIGGWAARGPGDARTEGFRLAIGAHRVFVADKRRPVEIRADAQDQLVQWLSNRMDRPVTVPDLVTAGLRFMGGRLVATTGGPAAQLMYDDDRGVRVTLFIEARPTGTRDPEYLESDGVAAFTWADERFAYTISAETARDRLTGIFDLVRSQIPDPAHNL